MNIIDLLQRMGLYEIAMELEMLRYFIQVTQKKHADVGSILEKKRLSTFGTNPSSRVGCYIRSIF